MTHINRDDADLARAIADGEEQALNTAYRSHGGAVYGLARRLLRNESLAEDVTQEVFVRLWTRAQRFDAARGNLRSFLLRDAHGRAVDLLRSEEARRAREERDGVRSSAAAPGPEQEVWSAVQSETVQAALSALPERERDAVVLAYYSGLSYKQVAEQLGEPEGTVKSRIRSGLKRLQGPLTSAGLTAS